MTWPDLTARLKSILSLCVRGGLAEGLSQHPPSKAEQPKAQQAPAAQAAATRQETSPQAPQAVVFPPQPQVDLSAPSIAQLLDSIVALKRSGLLGLLSYLADRADESFLAAATDPALMRLVAVLAALQQGLARVDAEDLSRAQNNVSDLTGCAFRALGSVDLSEERRPGLLGAVDKLMNSDVQTALWLLLEISKALGRCLREGSGKA